MVSLGGRTRQTVNRSRMSADPNKDPKLLTLPVLALWVTGFLCLGITLAVYSTHLNPGLPIRLGGLLTIFWAGFRILKGAGPYYHWCLDALIVFVLWAAISTTQSLDAYLSERSLATLCGGTGFTLAVVCAIQTARQWRATAYAFVGFISVTSLCAWPAAIEAAIKTGMVPPISGTFNNPDAFSVLPMLALCLSFGLLERTKKAWTALLLLQVGILSVTILGTGCRSAMLGSGIAALVFFGLLFTKRRSELQKTRLLLGFPLLIILALLPLSNFAMHGKDKVTKTLTSNTLGSESVRFEVAKNGWKAVARRPLLGSGPGAFGLSYQSIRPADHEDDYINIAHNDHIEAAVELGVPGFFLWAMVWSGAVHKTYQSVRKGRRPVEAAGVLAAVVAGLVFAFFNFIVAERPAFWTELFVLGLALSFPSRRLARRDHPLGRGLLTGCLLLLAIWSTQFGTNSLRAETLIIEAQAANSQLQFEKAASLWDQAVALQPSRAALRQSRAEAAQRLALLEGTEDPSPEAIRQVKEALKTSPVNTGVLVQLAELESRARNFDVAQALLERAEAAAPGSRLVDSKRLAVAMESNDLLTAAKTLKRMGDRAGNTQKPLTETLIALELATPGQGAKTLKPWLLEGSAQNEKLFDSVIASVKKRNLNEAARSFLVMKIGLDPEALCPRLELAQIEGLDTGPAGEFKALQALLDEAEPTSDDCFQDLLKRWTVLGRSLEKNDVVLRRLSETLEVDGRMSWARIELSNIYQSEGNMNEAQALLKEGLDLNRNDLSLNLASAKLYEARGSQDIALNYYREALKLEPTNREAKANIQKLLRPRKSQRQKAERRKK